MFCFWAAIAVVSSLVDYTKSVLKVRWRRWMTERYYGLWLDDGSLYRTALIDMVAGTPGHRAAILRSRNRSAAWHSKRRAHTKSHSAPTPSERVMGRLAVRLALQAIENRVYLPEPVRRVSVSLYNNPPSAKPEAVRRGRDHSNV